MTETPPEDPAAARFPRVAWPTVLAGGSASPRFARAVHLGDDLPSAVSDALPGARVDAPADAAPAALCDTIEAAHLRGAGAREGAARLIATLPLDEAALGAARDALDRTWPQA